MPVATFSLAQFSVAAATLGENTALRLKSDGSGVASTKWERFQVRVYDALFRDKDEVDAEKIRAFSVFLEVVGRERGVVLTGLAEATIRENCPVVSRLTGRDVSAAMATLTNHGGPNWLRNEMLINQLVYQDISTLPAGARSLQSIFTVAVAHIQEDQSFAGLHRDEAAILNNDLPAWGRLGGRRDSLAVISERIAATLRQKALRYTEDSVYIDALAPDEAEAIGIKIAQEFLTERVNSATIARYKRDFPRSDDLAEAFERISFVGDNGDPLFDSTGMLDWIRDRISQELGRSQVLLTADSIREVRQRVLDDFVNNQQEKLRLIKTLQLPGELKDSFVRICLESPQPMDARYFAALEKVATEIEWRMVRPSARSSETIVNSWLKLGNGIGRYASPSSDSKPDPVAIGTFIDLSVRLFVARAFFKPLQIASTWRLDQKVDRYVHEPLRVLVNTSDDRDQRRSAETACLVFGLLAAVFDEVDMDRRYGMPRNGKRVRLPNLAEIVEAERIALVAQAKEKGFSEEPLNTISQIYLDVFAEENEAPRQSDEDISSSAELESALEDAVKWAQEEGEKPSGVDESERILEFGQQLAREYITLPVIRKLNGEVSEAFLAEHPRARKAILKQERKDIEDCSDLLTAHEMLALREQARQKIHLRQILEPFEQTSRFRERVVRMGLDAHCYQQAGAGAGLLRDLASRVSNGEGKGDDQARLVAELRAGMRRLFATVQVASGTTLKHFTVLAEALFNDQTDEEIVDALDDWLREGNVVFLTSKGLFSEGGDGTVLASGACKRPASLGLNVLARTIGRDPWCIL